MTSTNLVNFPDYPHPSQDHRENYPFFQQNRNKQQKPYHTSNFLSSDDDEYYQPDNFAPHPKEYSTQKPRQNRVSQNIKYTKLSTDEHTKSTKHTILSNSTITKSSH